MDLEQPSIPKTKEIAQKGQRILGRIAYAPPLFPPVEAPLVEEEIVEEMNRPGAYSIPGIDQSTENNSTQNEDNNDNQSPTPESELMTINNNFEEINQGGSNIPVPPTMMIPLL